MGLRNKPQTYYRMSNHYYDNSYNVNIDSADRALMACFASEFFLKTLYYQTFPDHEIEGHISERLLNKICTRLNLIPPQEVRTATIKLKPHYEAARYPEITADVFTDSCVDSCQSAIDHYFPDTLNEILVLMETIIQWIRPKLNLSIP